jgi:hypothetical protein
MQRVVVLGGYGAFGAHAAERLAQEAGLELVIAGRSAERAAAFARQLARNARAVVAAAAVDADKITAAELLERRPVLLINASGPFQRQDYRVAQACIGAGVHYLDLADARTFVTGIAALDVEARQAGVLVVSGASTVPALSAAVVDAYAPRFAQLSSVTVVISPGNSFNPGVATTQSILSTLGRGFAAPVEGSSKIVHGWQGLRRRRIAGLGMRWLGACETPDLDLLPQRYACLRTVEVFAALEVGLFHLGLWSLSWTVRAGLLRRPQRLARPLLALKRTLRFLGSNVGGMAVVLEGTGSDGKSRRLEWRLIARQGHGPYIPATPSVIVAKRLLAGSLARRGAMPCLGLFTLADFEAEVAGLDIMAEAA